MANFGQQWRGIVQKARDFWADLTEDEGRKSAKGGEAMHQRFGTDEAHSQLAEGSAAAERARRDRDENSMDRGPDDSIMANPAARAGRQMGGSQRTASAQQAQDTQQTRQYTQQGGSGLQQKTPGQQMGGQVGGNDTHRDEEQMDRSRNRSGPSGRQDR